MLITNLSIKPSWRLVWFNDEVAQTPSYGISEEPLRAGIAALLAFPLVLQVLGCGLDQLITDRRVGSRHFNTVLARTSIL